MERKNIKVFFGKKAQEGFNKTYDIFCENNGLV